MCVSEGSIFYTFLGFNLRYWYKVIYQWFKVKKNCCNVYFHVLSSASRWREQAVYACLLSPSDWLTALWVTRDQAYYWSHSSAFTISLVNTAESHVFMFGYSYRRPATYLQSECFWTVSYTVLMFVQVLAGQSANVGGTSRVTVMIIYMHVDNHQNQNHAGIHFDIFEMIWLTLNIRIKYL